MLKRILVLAVVILALVVLADKLVFAGLKESEDGTTETWPGIHEWRKENAALPYCEGTYSYKNCGWCHEQVWPEKKKLHPDCDGKRDDDKSVYLEDLLGGRVGAPNNRPEIDDPEHYGSPEAVGIFMDMDKKEQTIKRLNKKLHKYDKKYRKKLPKRKRIEDTVDEDSAPDSPEVDVPGFPEETVKEKELAIKQVLVFPKDKTDQCPYKGCVGCHVSKSHNDLAGKLLKRASDSTPDPYGNRKCGGPGEGCYNCHHDSICYAFSDGGAIYTPPTKTKMIRRKCERDNTPCLNCHPPGCTSGACTNTESSEPYLACFNPRDLGCGWCHEGYESPKPTSGGACASCHDTAEDYTPKPTHTDHLTNVNIQKDILESPFEDCPDCPKEGVCGACHLFEDLVAYKSCFFWNKKEQKRSRSLRGAGVHKSNERKKAIESRPLLKSGVIKRSTVSLISYPSGCIVKDWSPEKEASEGCCSGLCHM